VNDEEHTERGGGGYSDVAFHAWSIIPRWTHAWETTFLL
jgi:hypothetical protein